MAELVDNTVQGRFEMVQEGQMTFLDYRREPGLLVLLFIKVPRALEGRGYAATLLRAVLGVARQDGLRVVPVCSYVQLFLQRHPEFADLTEGVGSRV